MLGKQYFYLNEVNRASYFHQRMIKAIPEPAESPIRKMFLKKLETRDVRLKLIALRHGSASVGSLMEKKTDHVIEYKVFESDDEDDMDMPISKVAKLEFKEKQKEGDFPRYFRLKRMYNNLSSKKNSKKQQFYTGGKSLSSDYTKKSAWGKQFQEEA